MTSEPKDGGLSKHLKKLQEEERAKLEARRRAQSQAVSATAINAELHRTDLDYDCLALKNARDAAREFARRASSKGITTLAIKVYAGERKGLFFTKDVYDTRIGWVALTGHDLIPHYGKDSESGIYQDYSTPPKDGLSVLADGTCLIGPPSRLTPLITPESYRPRASADFYGYRHSFRVQHLPFINGIPEKLAEFLHKHK